ncbi:CRISPR-associated endonuclease Cas2 [uncultured Agitococcus sp.]|uniref:CRISPR-associated endonuclease Cas2 n=1 Tax=uncultured Agitococcus sp. TaxID=1506599 RepID=UPI002602BFF4|nr:CRISPR-associated endonuclease Cas2 [uncultured Agitococcus sp.]
MWLVCAFDLPVTTALARKRAAKYRLMLLAEGFSMVQNSVYCRHFSCLADAQRAAVRYGKVVPPNGKVDFYFLTDRQMGVTMSFFGAQSRKEEIYDAPEQGELF